MSKIYDIIILEYGIDHPSDMDFLLKIAKPNISIFTKLDLIHLSNFNLPKDI
jgi:UDP-N-acetylmuramyl pentapeptide synthase